MPRRLPDLVVDSRLEAVVGPQETTHTFTVSNTTQGQRARVVEERWQRQKLLGGGGFGLVWLEQCSHGERKDQFRAVKKVARNVTASPINYARELEATAKFSQRQFRHCFVRSFGWYEDNDSVFIVMEYLPLGDLQVQLDAAAFGERDAIIITKQLLEGLAFMHESAFAHRDLKPRNILIQQASPRWWVKIADFGISKRIQELTELTTVVGTESYMAPEVRGIFTLEDMASRQDTSRPSYTFSVDIWAVGVIAARMVINASVFHSQQDLFAYVVLGQPLSFQRVALASPTSTERTEATHSDSYSPSSLCLDFIAKTMTPSPGKRLAACEAVLHPWMQSIGQAAAPPRQTPRVPTDAERTVISAQQSTVASMPQPQAGRQPSSTEYVSTAAPTSPNTVQRHLPTEQLPVENQDRTPTNWLVELPQRPSERGFGDVTETVAPRPPTILDQQFAFWRQYSLTKFQARIEVALEKFHGNLLEILTPLSAKGFVCPFIAEKYTRDAGRTQRGSILYLCDETGYPERLVSSLLGLKDLVSVAVSADGQRIATLFWTEGGKLQVELLDVERHDTWDITLSDTGSQPMRVISTDVISSTKVEILDHGFLPLGQSQQPISIAFNCLQSSWCVLVIYDDNNKAYGIITFDQLLRPMRAVRYTLLLYDMMPIDPSSLQLSQDAQLVGCRVERIRNQTRHGIQAAAFVFNDALTGRPRWQVDSFDKDDSFRFLSGGKLIALVLEKRLSIRKAEDGAVVWFSGLLVSDSSFAIDISRDSKYLALFRASEGPAVGIWQIETGRQIQELHANQPMHITGLSFSADGKYLVCRGYVQYTNLRGAFLDQPWESGRLQQLLQVWRAESA